MRYLIAFFGSLLASLVLTPLFRRLALRIGALDEPGQGKLHTEPIPYLGGVAMYLAFLVGATLGGARDAFIFLSLCAVVLVLGLYDDARGCHPAVKLSVQLSAAYLALKAGLGLEGLVHPFGMPITLGPLALPIALLWLVGMSNATNLIDGLDGLAGGVVSISSAFISVLAMFWRDELPCLLALSLAGASLGFLRYNFPPARIFMGDAGALFSGFALAGISLMVGPGSSSALPVAVVVLGLPILDTAAAVLRRLRSRRPLFRADMGHIHHRLLRLGFSRRGAVLLMYAASFCLGLYALALAAFPRAFVFAALALSVISALVVLSQLGRRRDVQA